MHWAPLALNLKQTLFHTLSPSWQNRQTYFKYSK